MTRPQAKTKSEKIAELKAKANDLINWFNGWELPPGPLAISPGVTVNNPKKHVKAQVDIMEGNSDPYNRVFVAAYYRLFNLKKYLQNESSRNINRQS